MQLQLLLFVPIFHHQPPVVHHPTFMAAASGYLKCSGAEKQRHLCRRINFTLKKSFLWGGSSIDEVATRTELSAPE